MTYLSFNGHKILLLYFAVNLIFCFTEATCATDVALIDPVRDNQLSASSQLNSNNRAAASRLNQPASWAAANNQLGEYLQVDFEKDVVVKTIATQGGGGSCDAWVESYTLAYRFDGGMYSDVLDAKARNVSVFEANSDCNTMIRRDLYPPVAARFVRIFPQTWRTRIAMRWEIYGCNQAVGIPGE